MGAKNYTDLIAWQKGIELVCAIYRLSERFPSDERFGLTSQIRRAAVSIPANIAEGQGRASSKEFANFLSIAHGSLREIETYVVIAEKLGFIHNDAKAKMLEQAEEVGRLLGGLRNAIVTPHA